MYWRDPSVNAGENGKISSTEVLSLSRTEKGLHGFEGFVADVVLDSLRIGFSLVGGYSDGNQEVMYERVAGSRRLGKG